MMTAWVAETLGNIADMVCDKISVSKLTVENYISTENMLPDRGGVKNATKLPLSGNVNSFSPGDVLFSNIRTYFKKVWIARRNGGASADVIVFRSRDSERLNSQFMYYILSSDSFVESTVIASKGTKMPRGDKDAMRSYALALPPLPIQRRIASILSAYDDLIENNQRRIRILEDMARSLYREWFVHFRYPGHESIPLVDSPLGPIPQGWEVKTVGDVADTIRGRSYRSVDLADEGGLPFLNLKCLDRDGGFRRSGLKRYIGEYKDSHVARKGDIVMAVTDMTQDRRIVARAALVPSLDNEFGVISMDFVRIEPKKGIPKPYLYSFLRYSAFADEVKQHANGANVLHLSPERITSFKFALPNEMLIERFGSFVAPTIEEMDVLQNQTENLRRTRDLLLPRLLSGDLNIEAVNQEKCHV